MRILISLVCACALLGFAHLAVSIIVPFLLALAVATAFQPISYRISRRGWPPVVSAVVSAVTMLTIVGGAGLRPGLIEAATSTASAGRTCRRRRAADRGAAAS